jgi:hypothetical protein
MAGYSGTPLPQKLGIKPGSTVAVLNAPDGFDETLGPLESVRVVRRLSASPVDVVVAFVTRRADLERRIPVLERVIFPAGGLWISWPKKSSGVRTDITEDILREVALPRGLVDNKVCAVDDTWSGLRLVWRKDRR